MGTISTSTSSTLLYVERPALNFAHYVEVLEKSLRETVHKRFELNWDNDDFVRFEVDGSRIVIGYNDLDESPVLSHGRAQPAYAAALVVSVGPGQRTRASTRIAEHAQALCISIIDRIKAQNEPDTVLWRNFKGPFTADHFDALIDLAIELPREEATEAALLSRVAGAQLPALSQAQAFAQAQADARHRAAALAETRALARTAAQAHDEVEARLTASDDDWQQAAADGMPRGAVPANLPGLRAVTPHRPLQPTRQSVRPVMRLLANARRAAETVGLANDVPEVPHPMSDELDRLRAALYPADIDEAFEGHSLARRLTIYGLNTTLLMVSLPIGAGMLVYNASGREDMKLTARVLALTALAVTTAHTLGAHLPGLFT